MQQKRLMTSTQAARHLGVSRVSLYKLVEAGDLAAYRILSQLRFAQADLDEFLDRARVPTKSKTAKTSKRRA